MPERRSNYMRAELQSSVASILYEIHLDAIRAFVGTDQVAAQRFAEKVRELSTRYTDPGGIIDKDPLPSIREEARETIVDSVRLNGAENFMLQGREGENI